MMMDRRTERDHDNNVESILIPGSKLEELLADQVNHTILVQIHAYSISTENQVGHFSFNSSINHEVLINIVLLLLLLSSPFHL